MCLGWGKNKKNRKRTPSYGSSRKKRAKDHPRREEKKNKSSSPRTEKDARVRPPLPEPMEHVIHSHCIRLTSLGALEETFGLDPRIHSCPPHAAPSSVGQTSHTRREGKGNEFIGLGSEFQGLWGIFIHTRKSSLPVMLPPRGVAMWTSSSPSISGRVCWALPCDFSWF